MSGVVRSNDRGRLWRGSRAGRSLVALAVAGVSLSAAAVAWAAAGPTGNRRAVAIARAEARAYTRIRAATYTQTGLIQMNDAEGRSSYFFFNWGQTKLKPGWSWATEHAVVALSRGRVVWWRDQLTPPPCRAVGVCHQIPVEIVSNHTGAYWAFGSPARHTCFGRLTGSQPVAVGVVFNQAFGQYSAPRFGQGTVQLTFTYPWGTGMRARETDTLFTRTHLVKFGRTVITGGHTIRFSYGYPGKMPKAPSVNLCGG